MFSRCLVERGLVEGVASNDYFNMTQSICFFFLCSLFAKNVSCNSTLDDGSQQFPDFPSHTEQSLSSMNITAKMVCRAIYDLDASKATGPDRIPAIVLKMCNQSLLSYTINALPNLVFLPVGYLHRFCQFLK